MSQETKIPPRSTGQIREGSLEGANLSKPNLDYMNYADTFLKPKIPASNSTDTSKEPSKK